MASKPRPLTGRQEKVLLFLLDAREGPGERRPGYPATPNEIGGSIGPFEGPVPRRNRGLWSGPMPSAQRVISSLNGLSTRGLVSSRRRRDGLSGGAYGLTEAGLKVARELRSKAGT